MIRSLLNKRKPGARRIENSWEWVCQRCGYGRKTGSAKEAIAQRKEHYLEAHSANSIDRIPTTTNQIGECGDSCSNWTGKKICMIGNPTRSGETKTCWRDND